MSSLMPFSGKEIFMALARWILPSRFSNVPCLRPNLHEVLFIQSSLERLGRIFIFYYTHIYIYIYVCVIENKNPP